MVLKSDKWANIYIHLSVSQRYKKISLQSLGFCFHYKITFISFVYVLSYKITKSNIIDDLYVFTETICCKYKRKTPNNALKVSWAKINF